jgi:hypothetical protein
MAVHSITVPGAPFKTVTFRLTCPPAATPEGGETNEIEIGCATTGNVKLLTADGLLATAAVKVTVFPMGTMEGAV